MTAFGDTNKTEVAGLPGGSGTYTGFYDTATAQMYTAALDGVARKTYFYTDIVGSPGQYWFTTAFWDFSLSVGVGEGEAISGNWSAATSLSKVG